MKPAELKMLYLISSEQKYFLMGMGAGGVVAIGILSIAIYYKYKPIIDFVSALSDIKNAILN